MALFQHRRWFAALLALALPLEACGGSAPAVRIRVPLAQNPEGDLAAERCVFDCRSRLERASPRYGECLASCPGAEIAAGERCEAADQAPRAVCVESDHDPEAEFVSSGEEKADVGAAQAIHTGVALASLLLDIASIGSKKRHSGRASGHAHGGSHHASSSKSHHAASPSKGHQAASPSKGHQAASPSKGSSKSSKPSVK